MISSSRETFRKPPNRSWSCSIEVSTIHAHTFMGPLNQIDSESVRQGRVLGQCRHLAAQLAAGAAKRMTAVQPSLPGRLTHEGRLHFEDENGTVPGTDEIHFTGVVAVRCRRRVVQPHGETASAKQAGQPLLDPSRLVPGFGAPSAEAGGGC